MAFEGLTQRLAGTFKKLKNRGKLSEADVKEAMREVRLALLEADVNYGVAKKFVADVTQKCIGAGVLALGGAGLGIALKKRRGKYEIS